MFVVRARTPSCLVTPSLYFLLGWQQDTGGVDTTGGGGATLRGWSLTPGTGERERCRAALGTPTGVAGEVSRDDDFPGYRSAPMRWMPGPRRQYFGVITASSARPG
jgi:hypothetical protein